MGVVYRAEDIATGARVAVKVIRGDPSEAARFAREARVLSRLEHPAIVRYVAHGSTEDGAPYLAMEWLEGEDLSERLERGPMALADTIVLARRIADGLATMHARGIVHRDLKPSNLFLPDGDPNRVTVLDFGVARVFDATIGMTATGAVIGTPGYMAPEQARGAPRIDARADVFALGCVVFECLTGRRVFLGAHVMAVLVKILIEEAPRVSELCPGVPDVLDDLIARMLSKDPDGRPADGAAVRAAIDGAETKLALAATSSIDIAARARPPSLSRGEQHLVSVVIAATPSIGRPAQTESLAVGAGPAIEEWGSSATAVDDPARIATLVLIARFKARVELLADGLLVASLRGTGAATDQAAQAARCALAIRAAFPTAPIVLSTGRAMVTGRLPVGPVIDRSVGMLRTVQDKIIFGPPSIYLDETTAGLLPSRFRLRPSELGTVLIEEESAADSPRTLLGKPTPFVGRDQELGTLIGLFRHVENDSVARATVVTGAPGLGKSRLRDELLRELGARALPPEVWIGSGDQLNSRAPLSTFARALRGTFGLTDAVPPSVAKVRVMERTARRVPEERREQVAAFIGELLGIPFDGAENVQLFAARQEPTLMAEQIPRAVIDLLRAECDAAPVVLVLEDAHWADAASVKLIGTLLRELEDRPFFVVAFARPEIDEAFPALWADRDVMRIALPPLPPRAAERLSSRMLGIEPSDGRVKRIVQQAAGNPFFLEELLRAALTDPGEVPLPETVLAMVQKRVEGLPEELRRLLRAACVFGPVFWRGGASALLGSPADPLLDGWLSDLVNGELIVRRAETRLGGEIEYGFRHGLVRDCAYLMLTDTDRALAHKLAGDWLERAGERSPALLAEHFERGGETRRAIEKYAQATAAALDVDDLESAIRIVVHALALGAEGRVRGLLLLERAEAHRWRGDFDAACSDAMQALEELPMESADWYKAIAGAIASSASTGRVTQATDLAERLRRATSGDRPTYLMALAQSATYLLAVGKHESADALLGVLRASPDAVEGSPLLTARSALAEAMHAHVVGNALRAFDEMIRAADHFERAGDRRSACAARANAGLIDSLMGRLDRAEKLLAEALEMARRGGAFNTVAWIKQSLAAVVAQSGRDDEGLTLAREAAEAARGQRDLRLVAKAKITEAEILMGLGRASAAAETARSAIELGEGGAAVRAGALAVLASALGAEKRDEEAHRAALEAFELLERDEPLEEFEAAVRLAFAESLFRLGKKEEARSAIVIARSAILDRAKAIKDPSERELFLRCVPAHARTLACAEAWGADCPPAT
jgi:eukaryotic-like serine/threonine-protein kinase